MKILKKVVIVDLFILGLMLPSSENLIAAIIGWCLLITLVFYVISKEKGTIPNLIIRDIKQARKDLNKWIISKNIEKYERKLTYLKERRA